MRPNLNQPPSPAASPPSAPAVPYIAIVGNPNSGKTTIFNLLTGLRQKVANYPGVTVEKKEGECYSQHGKKLRLIDLPGAYSLNARSPDEAVLRDVLLGRQTGTKRPDRVVCIVDASNLERHLYLVTQVLELGLPTILVLNMIDVSAERHQIIDATALSERLGIPVIAMQATTGVGLTDLKLALSREDLPLPKWTAPPLPEAVKQELEAARADLATSAAIQDQASLLEPLYLLSDHDPSHTGQSAASIHRIIYHRDRLEHRFAGWEDTLVNERYAAINQLCAETWTRPDVEPVTRTQKMDRLLLHPLWGGLIMLIVMAGMFWTIFSVAEGPMGWIENGFGWLGEQVGGILPPGDLHDLIVDGVIAGVAGVVVFLPQIVILFFFIGIMEDTGYMSRLAFIWDRVMSWAGLNGKAFLPILGSHACAIPGIMATRTIDSPKDRLITILVAPLASCSARLPVYLLLIAALVPNETISPLQKAACLLALYGLGVGGAFFFAWLFNRTLMRHAATPMILEMPSYKLPAFGSILMQVWQRAKVFLVRAGTVILGFSILIWFASNYPRDTPLTVQKQSLEERLASAESDAEKETLATDLAKVKSEHLAQSIAGRDGHLIEPLIEPLGYNWKIGIGLIGSFAARELFVSTMSVVYAVESVDEEDTTSLRQRLRDDRRPDGSPVFTPLVCLSLLIFYVFAMQCISTLAIVKRETNSWKWPLFQLGYMTGTAYLLSLAIYQIGTALGY
jgi:ferrous iron transport protein B